MFSTTNIIWVKWSIASYNVAEVFIMAFIITLISLSKQVFKLLFLHYNKWKKIGLPQHQITSKSTNTWATKLLIPKYSIYHVIRYSGGKVSHLGKLMLLYFESHNNRFPYSLR